MFTDWEVLLIVFGIGIGWALTNMLNRIVLLVRTYLLAPDRPARLVPNKVFEASTPALIIEPAHRYSMWKSRTRAFLFHAEMCRTPCNARDLKARIGLTRPKQLEYIRMLIEGGVVDIPNRGKGEWLMDWQDRREALSTLPYPREYDPPQFRTLTANTGETDRKQNRRPKQEV